MDRAQRSSIAGWSVQLPIIRCLEYTFGDRNGLPQRSSIGNGLGQRQNIYNIIWGSSNGRTAAFEAVNWGSSPCPQAHKKKPAHL